MFLAHAEHNLISNSGKSIKYVHLEKLANQLTFIGAYVIETAKACTVALMEARHSLVIQCTEKCVNWQKTEGGENNWFRLTSKLISRVKRTTRLFMANLLSNGLNEKVIICYVK